MTGEQEKIILTTDLFPDHFLCNKGKKENAEFNWMRRSGSNLICYIRPDGSKLVFPLFPPHSENSLKATLILEKEGKPVFPQENSTLFKVGFFGCQNSAARRKYVVALLIGRLFLFLLLFP